MTAAYGLIVFDWDGTLIDSLGGIVSAMQATIDELDLPPAGEPALRAVIGLGLTEALHTLFPGRTAQDYEHIRGTYRDIFLGGRVPARLFPGAYEVVARFAGSGYALAIATGKGRAGLDRELAETGLGDLIQASRCADECASKPAPQMLHELMEVLGHAPDGTLMVGDSEYDLLMARNAGVPAVAVSGGAHDDTRLRRHAPLAVIGSVIELPGVLEPMGRDT